VGYVALQKRRREQGRGARERTNFWYGIMSNPYLSMAAGLIFAYPAAAISFDIGDWGLISLVPWIPTVAFFAHGFRRLGHRRKQSDGLRFGGEKQLLMAIQDAGGSITPIEAALRTSLTVDEAEEILSRLASRGHLLVKIRDGVLCYALPGGRSDSL
jgi:hypothetical protein